MTSLRHDRPPCRRARGCGRGPGRATRGAGSGRRERRSSRVHNDLCRSLKTAVTRRRGLSARHRLGAFASLSFFLHAPRELKRGGHASDSLGLSCRHCGPLAFTLGVQSRVRYQPRSARRASAADERRCPARPRSGSQWSTREACGHVVRRDRRPLGWPSRSDPASSAWRFLTPRARVVRDAPSTPFDPCLVRAAPMQLQSSASLFREKQERAPAGWATVSPPARARVPRVPLGPP
jgi:hypothetical protein